jgi:hypothetical protein
MNIIEAVQKAEQGKLITNCFMKETGFYEYVSLGVFNKHDIILNQAYFRYSFNTFTLAEILTTSWEIIEFK